MAQNVASVVVEHRRELPIARPFVKWAGGKRKLVDTLRSTSFTAYGADGFGPKDQERLAKVARDLVARGAFVVLSNAESPIVRDLYQGFEIHEVQVARSVNNVGHLRGKVGELIIVGRGHS